MRCRNREVNSFPIRHPAKEERIGLGEFQRGTMQTLRPGRFHDIAAPVQIDVDGTTKRSAELDGFRLRQCFCELAFKAVFQLDQSSV